MQLKRVLVEVSCNFGCFIVEVTKFLRLIFNCSNFTTSTSSLFFLDDIICPSIKNISLSFTKPSLATIVTFKYHPFEEVRFLRLLPLSCKKIFLTSLFLFFNNVSKTFK